MQTHAKVSAREMVLVDGRRQIKSVRITADSSYLAALAFLSCAFLSGCINLGAVRSYADETKNLTAAFTPMLDGSVQSCKDRKSRIKLYTSVRAYDPKEVSRDVDALCDSIADKNKHAAVIAKTLTDYASVLAQLAGDSVPTTLDSSEDKLKTALGNVKDNGGKPLVADAKLSAVFALAKFISEQVTNYFRAKEIKVALNHHEAVEALGKALATYVKSNFMGYVGDEQRDLLAIKESVANREKTEYLAARYIQRELWVVQGQLDAKAKSAAQFEVAVTKMIASHKDLIDNVDKIGDKERFKAIFAFAKEVRSLNDQLKKAF